MRAESRSDPGPLRCALLAALCVAQLGGCALRPFGEAPAPPATPAELAAREENDPVRALLAFHLATRSLEPAALARERAALAGREQTPLTLTQQALLATRPPGDNLPRAIALLHAVLASPDPDAQALQPLAHLLVDQLLERHRLEEVTDRLTQQLERTGQHLKDTRRQVDLLKEKLDALAEIERTLPGRSPPATPPVPAAPERRTPP